MGGRPVRPEAEARDSLRDPPGIGKVLKNAQEIILHLCGYIGRNRACRKGKLWQVNFILIALLVLQGSLLQHAMAELSDGRSPQPVEGRHGSVAQDPIRDGPPRHRDAVLRGEMARRLFLGMAKVVQAQCANDDPRRIFDTLQARQGQEVFATVPAPVNLQLPETVLAQAALDDAAAVAGRAALRFRLNRWTEGRRSFHPAGLSSSLL